MNFLDFVEWWISMFSSTVQFLFHNWQIDLSGEYTLGQFLIACLIMSIVIGATITQLRSARLTSPPAKKGR